MELWREMGLYCFQQHGVNIFDNLISLTHVRSQRDYRTLSLSTKNQPHFYGQSSYVNYVLRFLCGNFTVLTLSWRRSLSYRNQSIDLQNKSMDWFLYDTDIAVKELIRSTGCNKSWNYLYCRLFANCSEWFGKENV